MSHQRCVKVVLQAADGASVRQAVAVVVVVVAMPVAAADLKLRAVETDGETGRPLLLRLVATFPLVLAAMRQLVRAKVSVSRGLLLRLQPHPLVSTYLVT